MMVFEKKQTKSETEYTHTKTHTRMKKIRHIEPCLLSSAAPGDYVAMLAHQ